MKQIILALSLITLITPQRFFAMDFDPEEGIPLATIYRPQHKSKKNLEKQLADFDKKINTELTEKKIVSGFQYMTRLNQDSPAILADDTTIKKFTHHKNSY